jgi:hypothetical protein
VNRFVFVSLAGLALFVSTGCPPPPNFLDGSIKSSHDLTFDTVELRHRIDVLAYEILYFKDLDGVPGGDDNDTVVKIVFNEPAAGVVVETPVDLTTEEADAVVQRVTAADDPFPSDFTTGSVTFLSAPVVDEVTKGEFAVTFTNGRTLNGAFETPLIEVGFAE